MPPYFRAFKNKYEEDGYEELYLLSRIILKLALTSPTSGGRSIGIVCLQTKSHGVLVSLSRIIFVKSESESLYD
jgi:hypothetical protein